MMRGKIIFGVIVSFIFLFALVFASPLEGSVSPTSAESGRNLLWNITIINNGESNVNFTQVNLTAPQNVSVVLSTNGTSADAEAQLIGQTLSWINNDGLVFEDSTEYFWINATGTYPGDYNLVVSVLDTNSKVNSTNLAITINEPSAPSTSYKSPTPSNGSEINKNYIPVNVTATDESGIHTIKINFYNSTGIISSQTSSTSPFLYNFTNLVDGQTYSINATANDTIGNAVFLSSRTITINLSGEDNETNVTSPTINVLSPKDNYIYSTNTIYFNATANESIVEWKVNYDGTNRTLSSINTSLSVPEGSYLLLFYGRDSEGDWGVNDDIYFTVNPQNFSENSNDSEDTNEQNTTNEQDEGEQNDSSQIKSSNQKGTEGQSKSNSSKILFFVIVGFICVAIVVVVVILLRSRNRSSTEERGKDNAEMNYFPKQTKI